MVCVSQLLDPEGLQRFPSSTPDQRLPRVVALAPGLAPRTETQEQFRALNMRLAQVATLNATAPVQTINRSWRR